MILFQSALCKRSVSFSASGDHLAAVKAVDKAIAVAQEQDNEAMVRVLEAGRAPLSEHMVEMGVRLPDRRARRGGRRKGEAA